MGGGIADPPRVRAQPSCDYPENAAPFCPVSEKLFFRAQGPVALLFSDVNTDGKLDVLTLHSELSTASQFTPFTKGLAVNLNTCRGDFLDGPHPYQPVANVAQPPSAVRISEETREARPPKSTFTTGCYDTSLHL